MKIGLTRDWSEFLSLLIAHRVKFLLIGGHAVAGHGEPRLTEDLDVFVQPTATNAKRLVAALTEFGFGSVVPAPAAFAKANKIFMLGQKPQRIDILTGIDGVTFAKAWAGRIEVEFESSPLYVIGLDALIANKRASGRPKDLLDLELLEAHRGAPSKPRRTPAKKASSRPKKAKKKSTARPRR